jgi:hypothetical protein
VIKNKWMKAPALALAVVGAAASLALLPQAAISATDNAALNLSGAVAAVVDVSVSGTAAAASLNLAVGHSETGLKIADITEMANTPAGYTVSVASANLAAGGRCGGTAGQACFWNATGAEDVAFTLLKGTTSLSFSGAAAQWSDTTAVQLTPLATVANIAYAVGATILPQGTYSETLTFTITSK